MVQAIYFFHPLVWLLSKKMNEYREMACDDSTVGQDKHTSVEYSRYLVEIAAKMTQVQLSTLSVSALIKQKNKLLPELGEKRKSVKKSKWRGKVI